MVATTPGKDLQPWYSRWELPVVLPALFLCGAMVWSVIESIIQANWAADSTILAGIVLLGLSCGVIFARLPWLPAWLAHPIALLLGLAWSIQSIGPVLVRNVQGEFSETLAARLTSWSDYAAELFVRQIVWLRILQAGGRGEDIVLFMLTLALVVWILGYATAWLVLRDGFAWPAVLINGLIILINYAFAYPKPTLLFFVFLTAALLLVVQQHIAARQRSWHVAHIEFPDWLAWRFLVTSAVVIVVTTLITAAIPGTVTNEEAVRAWRLMRQPFTMLRESWNDAFSTINAQPGTGISFVTRGTRAGGPRILGSSEVMRVRSSTYEYWRAVAFDRYNGLGWQNTVGERARSQLGLATAEQARIPIAAGSPITQVGLRGHRIVTQTVQLIQPRSDGLVLFGGAPVLFSLPTLLQSGFAERPNFAETAAVFTEASLQEGTVYTVTALVSIADETSLRAASLNYPAWVQAAYLQLPETLPQRVRDEAFRIVGESEATTPYDKALAIQNALRRFPYDESRDAPPVGRDWVDYFLFDGQRGYCDDFATAMVVLLRSVDVPARWVQGYAGGRLDAQSGAYIVTENVAHSWVEVYFPGYGWQRFEPTPAPYASVPVRPEQAGGEDALGPEQDQILGGGSLSDPDAIMRELRELDEMLNAESSDPEVIRRLIAERRAEEQRRQLALLATILASLGLVGMAGYWWFERDLRGLAPAAAVFARMARLGGLAGVPQDEQTTPHEYADELSRRMPEQRTPIMAIADAYEAERYSRRLRTMDATQLRTEWALLRWRLIGQIGRRIQELARPATPERRGPIQKRRLPMKR